MTLPHRIAILAATAVTACSFEATGPGYADSAIVRVTVTGGVAPVSLAYQVDTAGDVTGLACASGCSFAEGEILHHLTPSQQAAVLDAINTSGLPTAGRPVNFGTECCDQATFHVVYTSGAQVRSFTGGLASLPQPLQDLVRLLQLLYAGTPPVILAQSDGLVGLRTDPVVVGEASVVDDVLMVDLSYDGGCQVHDVDAVVFTPFMESDPVQVGVAMTHDAHGDACDALQLPSLRFDLAPLRSAWSEASGIEHGTLRLRLEPGNTAGTGVPILLEYTF